MKLWRALLGGQQEIARYSVEQYIADLSLAYGGNRYLLGGSGGGWTKTEDIEASFTGYINSIYKSNGVVFAIILARMLLFSEARFCWFDIADNGEDGRPAGREGLEVIETPWPNGSTGELLSRMEQDVSLGGNFYAVREPNRLRRLRPDWLTIVLTAPPAEAVESDVAGYWYHPGRTYSNAGDPTPGDEVYLPDEVAHFSPVPDPDAQYRGMSWLTPGVREVMADKAATDHKLAFFENGATLGPIISAKENLTNAQFKEWKENFSNLHTGTRTAYKPLFLASPVDTNVTTATLQQLEFKVTQGAGETRLCAMGGVPPIIVGLSEGLASATYSNYGMARRKFGDGWAHPQWKMASTALSSIVQAPRPDVRLGVNTRGIAFLREDAKDLAEIMQIQASAVSSFITAGYEPDSAAAAVDANDLTLLKHTGLTSVQLMPPGSQDTDGDGTPDAEAAAADEYAAALDEFRAEFLDDDDYIERKYYDIRVDAGHKGGGQFRRLGDIAAALLNDYLSGKGDKEDPLGQFKTTRQLRTIAEQHAIAVRPGMTVSQLKKAILDDAAARFRGAKAAKSPDVGKPVRFTLTGGSVDPKLAREVEVENKIRAAYRKATQGPGKREWVSLADIRDELSDLSREEQDQALDAIRRQDGVRVVPIHNTKGLTDREYAAALQISGGAGRGGHDLHAISIDDPSPRPVPKPDSKLRDLDVTVHTESNGKISLWETSDSGERRRRVALVDDLPGLAAWADEHGESELAGWARKERGGEAAKAKKAAPKGTRAKAGTLKPGDKVYGYQGRYGVQADPPEAGKHGLSSDRHEYTVVGRTPDGTGLLVKPPWVGDNIQLFGPSGTALKWNVHSFERVSPDRTPAAKATKVAKEAASASGPDAHRAALIRRPLDRDALATIEEYHGGWAAGMNGALRTGRGTIDPANVDAVRLARGMDDLMSGQELAGPIAVDRGVVYPQLVDMIGSEPKAGSTFVDHGFVSTTTTGRPRLRFGEEHAVLHLRVPAGVRAVSAPQTGGFDSFDPGEVVLDRGLTYRVTNVDVRDGVRHLEVEVVPPGTPATRAAPAAQPADLSHLRTLDPEAARDELDLRKVGTVDEPHTLKGMLKAQGLPVSGKKRDLVDRLVESLGQPTREERIKQLMLSGLTQDEAEAQLAGGTVRPSGLATDRKLVSGDFDDLASRLDGRSEQQILAIIADLNATELARLARKYEGARNTRSLLSTGRGRRSGLHLPPELSLEERKLWFAKHLTSRKNAWRSEAVVDEDEIERTEVEDEGLEDLDEEDDPTLDEIQAMDDDDETSRAEGPHEDDDLLRAMAVDGDDLTDDDAPGPDEVGEDEEFDDDELATIHALLDEEDDEARRGQPYPGQRYKHGWIPIAFPEISRKQLSGSDVEVVAFDDSDGAITSEGGRLVAFGPEGSVGDQPEDAPVYFPDVNADEFVGPLEAFASTAQTAPPVGGESPSRLTSTTIYGYPVAAFVDDADALYGQGVRFLAIGEWEGRDDFDPVIDDVVRLRLDEVPDLISALREALQRPSPPSVARADLALGRERLHHYWTRGKGLAKWLGRPHPWTTLYRHLRKYVVGSERAKRMAAKWVHEVTGNWPGSDAHRVATGHKPRGNRVGPG